LGEDPESKTGEEGEKDHRVRKNTSQGAAVHPARKILSSYHVGDREKVEKHKNQKSSCVRGLFGLCFIAGSLFTEKR
jgi:hypothetical protein